MTDRSAIPSTALDLMGRITPARAALEQLVVGLDAEPLTRSPAPGAWSAKDHLAHIAAWERMIVAHLRDGADHGVVGMSAGEYANASLDTLNARLHELHVDDPLDAVLTEFADAHREIVPLIQGLTPSALAQTYWPDDPEARTIADKIAGDTYLHYEEHRGWIAELIQAR